MHNIVLFGDSITAGVINGFPSPLFSRMIRDALGTYEIINRGGIGDQARTALTRLQTDVLSANPQVVVIFFGTNDCADPNTSPKDFQAALQTMIDKIGRQRCVLVTPGITSRDAQQATPLFVTMNQYVQVVLKVGQANKIPTLNWQQVCQQYSSDKLLQTDGIHYSKDAYRLLTNHLLPLIKTQLNRN